MIQTLNVSGAAGDAFTFSYWVKGSAIPTLGNCQGQILFFSGTTLKGVKTLQCPALVMHGFKKMTLNITASAAYTNITVKFTYRKPGGVVWFDMVSLLPR